MTDLARARHRATVLALAAALGLTALKMGVGWIADSSAVRSEGVHSLLDLVSAAVAFLSVRAAVAPADSDHPFGHGRIETLSSLFEALLLVAAAVWIMIEGVARLWEPRPIQHENLALWTMGLSMVASFFVWLHNRDAARITSSPAIRANAAHFLTDVVAAGGVLVGLGLQRATGWLLFDPLTAIAVGAYILLLSYRQLMPALHELIDARLPAQELGAVERALARHLPSPGTPDPRALQFHDLRSRRLGAGRAVDFHLVVCGKLSVRESHRVCDEIEEELERELPGTDVQIHVEPCGEHRVACPAECARE